MYFISSTVTVTVTIFAIPQPKACLNVNYSNIIRFIPIIRNNYVYIDNIPYNANPPIRTPIYHIHMIIRCY